MGVRETEFNGLCIKFASTNEQSHIVRMLFIKWYTKYYATVLETGFHFFACLDLRDQGSFTCSGTWYNYYNTLSKYFLHCVYVYNQMYYRFQCGIFTGSDQQIIDAMCWLLRFQHL